MTKRSRLLLAAGAVLALVLAGTFALSGPSSRSVGAGGRTADAASGGDEPAAGSSATRDGSKQGSTRPREDDRDRGSEQPPEPATERSDDRSADEPSDESRSTVSEKAGYRLPRLPARRTGPLVSAPLPPASSRRGGLVRGYPEALAVVPGARVRSSSVSGQGRRLQVALEAQATRAAVGVERFHRVRLARLGFVGGPVPAVGGSTAIAFRRGQEHLVLTLTPSGRHTSSYSLFGVLRVGS